MKIKDIYLQSFGPYRDWSFTSGKEGVQFIYGSNESGKTSLLQAMRALLFGLKSRNYKECIGHINVERADGDYHIGRNGKKLDFYKFGEQALAMEPTDLWWYGLDKKTYDRIFALTLDDLQGADIMTEVEVRSRFFGAEGGERISAAVKDIEKAANELLVASANGKRKINVLMEQLRQNQEAQANLIKNEDIYRDLQQQFMNTEKTEQELQSRLNQWMEYIESIDLVLRAWDTFKRMEEARSKMSQLTDVNSLEKEEFAQLDQEINQCQEYMRIWRGKEEGLVPDNYSPDSPIGIYSKDIEALYMQLGTWERLQKDCEEGQTYLKKVEEQLSISRTMHTAWRADKDFPLNVDWQEGERLAQELRSAREAYQQWQYREPINTVGDIVSTTTNAITAENNMISEEELDKRAKGVEDMAEAYQRKVRCKEEIARMQPYAPDMKKVAAFGSSAAAFGVILYFFKGSDSIWFVILSVLLILGGLLYYGYNFWRVGHYKNLMHVLEERLLEEQNHMERLAEALNLGVPYSDFDLREMRKDLDKLQKQFYGRDVALAQLHGYEKQHIQWVEEGKLLEAAGAKAFNNWKDWLPEAANKALTDSDFFGMKQEFDNYQTQLQQFKSYKKTLAAHEEQLGEIQRLANDLWKRLGLLEHSDNNKNAEYMQNMKAMPTPTDLRRLYNELKLHQQNTIRWEQKEAQRKNFREEFDQWNRKEKELLIRQNEIIQRAGLSTASEYRQKLLSQDQYQQWETIYKQSQVQLKLLAPRQESYDLLCRRLRDGNKTKWVEEYNRSQEEVQSIEQQLATLYETRGQLNENMRNLGSSKELGKALQARAELETELKLALEDWTTQVLINHFIERAQQDYEKEKQPQVLEIASDYISKLTEEKYRLDVDLLAGLETASDVGDIVCLLDEQGRRIPRNRWSSGLADQVYLALRLSLAVTFSQKVESLPIILDDILIRFDEHRQMQALQLLAQLGKTQQIWVLSCQEQLLQQARLISGIDCHELKR